MNQFVLGAGILVGLLFLRSLVLLGPFGIFDFGEKMTEGMEEGLGEGMKEEDVGLGPGMPEVGVVLRVAIRVEEVVVVVVAVLIEGTEEVVVVVVVVIEFLLKIGIPLPRPCEALLLDRRRLAISNVLLLRRLCFVDTILESCGILLIFGGESIVLSGVLNSPSQLVDS